MWPFKKKSSKLETWPIVRSGPRGPAYGRSISLFINNGQCHLTTVDVYSDGAINCWGVVDRHLFLEKLRENWVVPAPSRNQSLFVFNFGWVGMVDGTWKQNTQKIIQEVDSIISELNPEQQDLLDLEGSETELRGNVRYSKFDIPDQKHYRKDPTGTHDILGDSVPVLRIGRNGFELSRLIIFADGLCQLGSSGKLVPITDVPMLYENGDICNQAPRGSKIVLPGLGDFRATDDFGYVSVSDRIKELHNLLDQLNGKPDIVQVCRDRFEEYSKAPTPEAKEALREAYDAVPNHLRPFCGDMDSKDWPIRAVLYGTGSPAPLDKPENE